MAYDGNRYYDPSAGRFTQEDPIGLAGGVNLYGYAGADPANNSDPFGLCPIAKDGVPCAVTWGLKGAAAGAVSGAIAGAAGGTLVLPVVGTIAGGGALGITGGVAGLATGMIGGATQDVINAVGDLPSAFDMGKVGNKIRSLLSGLLIGKGGGMSDAQDVIYEGGAKPATEQTAPQKPKEKKNPSGGDNPPDKNP